jgi:hypothetical protein
MFILIVMSLFFFFFFFSNTHKIAQIRIILTDCQKVKLLHATTLFFAFHSVVNRIELRIFYIELSNK